MDVQFLMLILLLISVMAYSLGFKHGHTTNQQDRKELWQLRHQSGIDELTIKALQNENDALRKLVILHEHSPIQSTDE